ncbi:unannotated protein [freshwater metagenome]|uniref:Unannotated protein n=1 Tax=freshwater metagenome TaxID=449393 RepID=A0A6J7B5K0_9ZZZZ|nr:hypothetical protein [Actinomycetota bacterium]MSY51746.1 hypothetical protein [Actinomycetota bacterium]MSY86851.1 hypothetical protein [Actinomycetota bacterium]
MSGQGVERGFLLDVVAPAGEPLFFTWRGRAYRVHSVLSRWCESGGWWQRASTEELVHESAIGEINDGARTSWRVEAAPEGALAVYDLERDESSGLWRITHHG